MSKFGFQRVLYALQSQKEAVAKSMLKDSQNYFLNAFKRQAYHGQPWREVQRRIPGMPAYEYPKTKGLSRRSKPILILSGVLRREVSLLASRATVRYSKYDFRATMKLNSSTVPYAEYLMKGTKNMVARPFMGDTPELRRLLKMTLKKYVDKAWKA